MPIELPSNPGVIEDRLASLEDPILAERLFLEHPGLYEDEPPSTQRQVLAWATRRFGTAALAVTAAVSIAAGYFLSPLVLNHRAPAQSVNHTTAVVAPSRPAAHRHNKASAPLHVAHRSAVAHRNAVAHKPRVVHVPAVPAFPNREELALRAKLQAQEAEIAVLRRHAAAEAAAARLAQARASAAISAAHRAATPTAPAPAPQTQPRTAPAPRAERSTSVDQSVSTRNAPVDVPVPVPDAGTKPPPTGPNGGWSEHPPIPLGVPGTLGPFGGPPGPCTPQGGRVGIVLRSILGQSGLNSHLHIRL